MTFMSFFGKFNFRTESLEQQKKKNVLIYTINNKLGPINLSEIL